MDLQASNTDKGPRSGWPQYDFVPVDPSEGPGGLGRLVNSDL
jgi:hypothetical protein